MVNLDDKFPGSMKALKFAPGVVRTAATDPVIAKLDDYFALQKHPATITSVLRDPNQQLGIIQTYAIKQNLIRKNEVLDFVTMLNINGRVVPKWQWIWSNLLTRQVIVNPPKRAVILTDYWKSGINEKGWTLSPSEHFLGTAFDIGGGAGNPTTAMDEYSIVVLAAKHKIGIHDIVIERENNCVHVSVA